MKSTTIAVVFLNFTTFKSVFPTMLCFSKILEFKNSLLCLSKL